MLVIRGSGPEKGGRRIGQAASHGRGNHQQVEGGGVGLAKGLAVPEVCRKLGVAEQTYYRWRKEYGGLRREQAKRLRELEQENLRLKKLVADLSLDNAILKEAVQGDF